MRQVIYGKIKQDIGQMLRKLCEYKVCQLPEFTASVTHSKWFRHHLAKGAENGHHALPLGNIYTSHIIHYETLLVADWIFGDQPFHHCRFNLSDDTDAPVWRFYLHKSNAANERLADGLSYGRIVQGVERQTNSSSF